jgi:hypothetical protein
MTSTPHSHKAAGATAPQPSTTVDRTIETVFSVASMAVMALQMIPNMPPQIAGIVTLVVQDMEKAYEAYKANPSADLIANIKLVVDQGFDDVASVLHPPASAAGPATP